MKMAELSLPLLKFNLSLNYMICTFCTVVLVPACSAAFINNVNYWVICSGVVLVASLIYVVLT